LHHVASDAAKSQLDIIFLTFDLHFMRKGRIYVSKTQFYNSFSTFHSRISASDVAKTCAIAILRNELDFARNGCISANGCPRAEETRIAPHICASDTRDLCGHVSMDEAWLPLPPKE
jgi:hypothetical protein